MLGKLAPQRHDFFPNMKIMPEILIVIGTRLIRIGSVTVAYDNLIVTSGCKLTRSADGKLLQQPEE
jgi:hypothetical protein